MTRETAKPQSLMPPVFLGVVIFAATVIASIPASAVSIAANKSGGALSYAQATGTIWNGDLQSASAAGVPLGDVKFRLSPLSLLRFSPEATVSMKGAISGNGTVAVGPGARAFLRNVNAEIDLAAAAPRGLLGEPARGRAKLDIERLEFSRAKGCVQAAGDLWTDALDAPAKRYDLPSLPMSGGLACEDGKLVVALAGENARTAASVRFVVDRDLAYEATATARSPEESVASALRYYGFEDDNGAMTYGTVGVLTGAGS